MSGLLDEVQMSSDPRLYVCPCCKLSFSEVKKYANHLRWMKATIDEMLEKVLAEAPVGI